mmetsp:Transcript_8396/g.19675  ORF Transcript_8396/g.19675 Transcript_8396/m.19675 type:complete len:362 (-) Transcript_8396:3-1088(-)
MSRILSSEKASMPKMKLMSTSLLTHRRICAAWLIMRILRSTSSSAASSTRSHLLSRMRSAKATCSTASFSTPSGFSSSRCAVRCLASTTVRMPSRASDFCTKSSAKKVCATGAGSASPVVSISTPSSAFPDFAEFLINLLRPAMRSPRTVQQMQPLFISTTFSSVVKDPASMSSSSIPTSPNSFSMTPMRLPWCSLRMRFSRVVLPLPRKPVMTVTGTLSDFFGSLAAPSTLAFFSLTLAPSCCAQLKSRAARLLAPRPVMMSPRSSNILLSCALWSLVNLASISAKNSLGCLTTLPSLPLSSFPYASMQALMCCTPSKNRASFSADSASARLASQDAMLLSSSVGPHLKKGPTKDSAQMA